ncbi:hypothetical protein SF12_01960 [Streptomyces sp. MBRL 601]|nr:hypothetical protein SF12_01960 [Streptomyces sp. MBRL 601]
MAFLRRSKRLICRHAGTAEEPLLLQLHSIFTQARAAERHTLGRLVHGIDLPHVAVVVGLAVPGRELQPGTVAGPRQDDLAVAAAYLLLQEVDQVHSEWLEDFVSFGASTLLDHGPLHAVLQPRAADDFVREDL